MRIHLLDLFSGIGGFSLALHKSCKTIAYCELSVDCQEVLKSNMAKRQIDRAPIFDDVKTLQAAQLPSRPVVITAGFPCQDLSIANVHGQGLLGSRSNLLKQVFRIVDECGSSVQVLLLENVANIVTKPHAMTYIENAFRKRGFQSSYMTFACTLLGAPMRRKRWYCLAVRGDSVSNLVEHICRTLKATELNPWIRDYRNSKVIKQVNDSSAKHRCAMLGNTVVPACVAYAFQQLSQDILQKTIIPQQPLPTKKWAITITDGKKTKVKTFWNTPSAQVKHWYACYSAWTRCSKLLCKQVFMELGTVKKHGLDAQKTHEVNPCFVEWLMGYPRNYTLVKKT
jgi:hypothetical protein